MLKMGVVGVGIGGSHGAKVHRSDIGELTAICDKDPERLKWRLETYAKELDAHPRGYADFEEMLDKEALDGVFLAVPSGLHHNLAVIAAKRGVAMLIDKPLDVTIENIEIIQKAVKEAGVFAGVNYQMRMLDGYYTVRKAIEAGAFGKLLMVDVRLKWFRDQAYYDRGGWRGTWAMDGGGSLMNQGAHPMDLLVWFAGKPKRVRGDFAPLNHNIETEDWAAGIVEFAHGVRAVVNTTTNVAPKNDRIFFEIHGTEGSAWLVDDKIVETNIEMLKTPLKSPYPNPVIRFMRALKEGLPPAVPLEEARWSVELITAIYESARRGETVDL